MQQKIFTVSINCSQRTDVFILVYAYFCWNFSLFGHDVDLLFVLCGKENPGNSSGNIFLFAVWSFDTNLLVVLVWKNFKEEIMHERDLRSPAQIINPGSSKIF